jgi:hypothetical protein
MWQIEVAKDNIVNGLRNLYGLDRFVAGIAFHWVVGIGPNLTRLEFCLGTVEVLCWQASRGLIGLSQQ